MIKFTSMIKFMNVVHGYEGNFFYYPHYPLDPVYIMFKTTEMADRFKRVVCEMMSNGVFVNEVLEMIGVDRDDEVYKTFEDYYWGPEDYFVHNHDGERQTLMLTQPNLNYKGILTDMPPRCSGRYPWNDNNKGGITPMNTSVFKNTNAYNTYKTFIDKLRCNGADMHMRMSVREFPDITINTNTIQILRALEAIQPFDIPEIVDYKFYADRVTIVKFADGSYTKCEVQGEDKFDPDTGIIFCVVKKMLGIKGHERFNDILRKAHAAHKKVEVDKQKASEEKRARKEKAAQARAKKLEREEEQKRQAIDIQKQAYVEAIAEVATKKPATRGRKKVDKE